MRRAFAASLVLFVSSCAIAQEPPPAPVPERLAVERVIPAPRAEVWNAITTREGIGSWLATAGRIELRPGGAYEIFFDPAARYGRRGSETCRVLSYVDGQMLSVSWNAPPQFEGLRGLKTFVVFQLEDGHTDGRPDGSTLVRITHDGFRSEAGWHDIRAYFATAWPNVLTALQRWFETSEDARPAPRLGDRPAWRPYIYFIRPAREGFFDGTTEEENVALHGHVRHIQSLLDTGRLVLAGPSEDPAGVPRAAGTIPMSIEAPGIVVFLAADDEEARGLMEADPAVAAGVFKAQVNRFKLSFMRQ